MKSRTVPALPFTGVSLREPIQRYRCPRDWSWNVRLNDYDLWLAFQGKGELLIDGQAIEVVAPQVVLLRPGEQVRGRHDPANPLEVIALHFTPLGKVKDKTWPRRLRTLPLRSVEFFRETAERLVDEHARGDGVGAQTSAALAMALFGVLWRQAHTSVLSAGEERMEALIRQVQREPERAWTVEQLARDAGMGRTRLGEVFRRMTGCAPMAWVIRCRLARATWLLRETDLKLEAVAEACGYRDGYFFSRQFKRFIGVAPGVWRKAPHPSSH